ncbi:hypothetical protein ACJMK2_004301 [Sinanodonta woodiana]|uniref:Uncharacterized protein n=1 Tax=Sinanodonta woodiana TaxID=1069815 RepID=A0ABD3Y275_SINWO
MANATIDKGDGFNCPICLCQFNIPRQLPCAHNICHSCLQSYITAEATKYNELGHIKCPICMQTASPSVKDRPIGEWASLFPVNELLESMLPVKANADRMCDSCSSENVSTLAEGFCVVCKEAMCTDCLKFHRRQKMTKSHAIVSVDEFNGNPQNAMKLGQDLYCLQHEGEYVKFYCKDHKVAGCGTCFFHNHNTCSNRIDLKNEVTALLREINPDEIISDMEKIESHLQSFMKINECSICNVESDVNKVTDLIKEIRIKINSLLDDLENGLKTEGNRIYKEENIRIQEENHKCLSLMHAVKTSRVLFKTVNQYGSEMQKFIMVERMQPQLHSYLNLVREKFEMTDRLIVKVELVPQIESILSLCAAELGKIVSTRSSNVLPSCVLIFPDQRVRKPAKDCQVERVDVIDLSPASSSGYYSGVTFIPGDRVMVANRSRNQCILLSSSYQFISNHTLNGYPFDICEIGGLEVAVSLSNAIQILSVNGGIISPVRTITTNCTYYGIAATGTGNMAVTGNSRQGMGCWILMSTEGKVKASYDYEYLFGYYNYIAFNNANTRVYVSVYERHSLHCFDMEGRNQFTYCPGDLRGPLGVAVDRYDNIYIPGYGSNNIHQLSPDGSALQVITNGVSAGPCAISFCKVQDMFIITNYNSCKLSIYKLK